MDQQDSQSTQKSSIDKANDFINNARRIKSATNLTRTVSTGIQATQALLGSVSITGWGIAAALIMVFVSTFLISILGGGGGATNAGTPPPVSSTCASVGGACRTSCLTNETEQTASCDIAGNKCCTVQTPPANDSHFYCQYGPVDSQGILKDYRGWNTNSCDIYYNGCGPTSLAMILSSFGDTYTPTQVGITNHMGCTGAGTRAQLDGAINWVVQKGYVKEDLHVYGKLDTNTVKKYTSRGYLVIAGACMTVGWSADTSSTPLHGPIGHSIVIKNVNDNGTLQVLDPTFCSPGNHGVRTLDPTLDGKDVRTGPITPSGCHFSGWGYAIAIKLKQNGQ